MIICGGCRGAAVSAAAGGKPGRAFIIAFGLACGAVTVQRAIGLISVIAESIEMRDWVERSASIEYAELHTHVSSGRLGRAVTHSVSAAYSYEFDGHAYHGSRVSLYPQADNIGSFQEDTYAELDRGRHLQTRIRCYVDPQSPTASILLMNVRPEMVGIDLLFIVPFGFMGGYTIYGMIDLVQRRRRRSAQAPDQ